MKIILQKDVKNLGKAGDQANVKKGYARNFLLPKKLAVAMDESRAGEWRDKRRLIESMKKKAALERKALLERLSSVSLVFERESRAEGRLFGSVSPAEISAALEESHGILVDKKDISLKPAKHLGEHQAEIALDSNLKTEITLLIKKKPAAKEGRAARREPEKPQPETALQAAHEAQAPAGEKPASLNQAPAEKPQKKPPKKFRKSAGKALKKPAGAPAGQPPQAPARPAKKAAPANPALLKKPAAAPAQPAKPPDSPPPAEAATKPEKPEKPKGILQKLFSRKK